MSGTSKLSGPPPKESLVRLDQVGCPVPPEILDSWDRASLGDPRNKPHAVCHTCQGVAAKNCVECNGQGFVNETQWNTRVPEAVKEFREKAFRSPGLIERAIRDQANFKAAIKKIAPAKTPQDILKARRFNPLIKPAPLRAIYTLAGRVIGTPGNLVAIASAPKIGKSAVVGAMIASAMSTDGTADLLGFASENPAGRAVLHFDSEQSPDDHWHSVSRALKRANATDPPTWLHSYCLTGLGCSEAWACVREAIKTATEECGGVHSILIDGVADLVSDVNDAAECNAFVAELHELAIRNDCPIVGVIHFNPGGEKTRGHLGSQFERKAETNLRLDKNEDVTTIWSVKQRRAPIPEKDGPCFQWNDVAKMHVSVQNPSEAHREAKAAANFGTMRADAESVFTQGKKPALAHGELVELTGAGFNLKRSGARRRVERWVDCQIVRKDDAGFYSLNP